MKSKQHIAPPRLAEKLLLWFLKDELAEEVQGDLEEKFYSTLDKHSARKAKKNYWYQVCNYLRPFAFKFFRSKNSNQFTMIKHSFKISFRQMMRNKVYSFINVGGLAMGMVVTMLIGLWVQDELSFNRYHQNYQQISHLLRQERDGTGEMFVNSSLTTGMGQLVAESFPDYVEEVVMVRARTQDRVLTFQDNKFRAIGVFMQAGGPEMLSLEMTRGSHDGLKEVNSVILSESMAKRLFGETDPMNKLVKLDARVDLMVTGVYKDIPKNSRFSEARYFSRIELVVGKDNMNVWNNYNVDIYLKLAPGTDLGNLSEFITDKIVAKLERNGGNAEFFLHPMKDWHLHSAWIDGKEVTSRAMKFVWLCGVIGAFVLILACINFMNLSTARSEKRSREVGIRKSIGSIRRQLIAQFYSESLLYCLLAFVLSLGLLAALLPWFNETAGKAIVAPWSSAPFWAISLGFIFLTTLLAGSYPALYLSSFNPIKALKGTVAAGRKASIPRKVLVVFQFTISIALIIGTITINNQIQTARNRPVGYSPEGMLSILPASPNFGRKKELLKTQMLQTGMVEAVGSSNYPVTSTRGWNGGFSWEGMDPSFARAFNTISISHDYGEAVGLEFVSGRDFSDEFETDKNAILINRSAMEAMQLNNPVGTVVRYAPGWTEPRNYTIIGVVEDMIKGSPFEETRLSIMFLEQEFTNWMYIRLNPDVSASKAIPVLEKVYNEILPEAPFDFHFADDDYDAKFDAEIRIGKLASFFSALAILISCLGLFGLASYLAEQRTKEIGIRKVLGASVLTLWKLLSRDFALLVLLACVIAIPIAYSVLNDWLSTYEVRTQLYWWIFAVAGGAAMLFTLLTVSYQAIKAAIANPVKSLRTE